MTEEDLLRLIIGPLPKDQIPLAQLLHWRSAHFRPAKTAKGWRTAVQGDGKGWVDLILCRPPRLILAELKSDKGKLAIEQDDWLNLLYACPQLEVHVWRPRDIDEIVRIMA